MMNKLEQVRYSILELALVCANSTPAETLQRTVELAQHAERLGYQRFWLAEHHNAKSIASSATAVLIGHVAGETKRIRVGSGGIMLPNHSTLIIAEQFGTLGALYPDRIDLGLGRAPGTDQETAHAIRSDRMQAIRHFPDEVRQIQQYFSVDNQDARVRAHIAEGIQVPIYILGSSTDSAHLAAKLGLPYAFASHFATSQLMEALHIYHNEFEPSIYQREPYTMAGVNVIVADSTDKAERMMTSLIRMFVGILTGKREYVPPPTEMTSDLRDLLNHPQVQQMLKYAFVGDRKSVKKQTADFLEMTKVDELIAVTNIYDAKDRLDSYALFAEIMEEINEPSVSF